GHFIGIDAIVQKILRTILESRKTPLGEGFRMHGITDEFTARAVGKNPAGIRKPAHGNSVNPENRATVRQLQCRNVLAFIAGGGVILEVKQGPVLAGVEEIGPLLRVPPRGFVASRFLDLKTPVIGVGKKAILKPE